MKASIENRISFPILNRNWLIFRLEMNVNANMQSEACVCVCVWAHVLYSHGIMYHVKSRQVCTISFFNARLVKNEINIFTIESESNDFDQNWKKKKPKKKELPNVSNHGNSMGVVFWMKVFYISLFFFPVSFALELDWYYNAQHIVILLFVYITPSNFHAQRSTNNSLFHLVIFFFLFLFSINEKCVDSQLFSQNVSKILALMGKLFFFCCCCFKPLQMIWPIGIVYLIRKWCFMQKGNIKSLE